MAKKMISIRLEESIIKKIDEKAKMENRARTNYIETVVIRHAEGNDKS